MIIALILVSLSKINITLMRNQNSEVNCEVSLTHFNYGWEMTTSAIV